MVRGRFGPFWWSTSTSSRLLSSSAEHHIIENESVPKIIINDTRNLFLTAMSISVISNHNSFRLLFDKSASVYFIGKYIDILALEMASPANQHCANCVGTHSFSVVSGRTGRLKTSVL